MPLRKPVLQNAKPLRTSDAIVASSVTIGSSTINANSAQSLSDRVLDTYYMQNSEIESTPIGTTFPATGNFTYLTTGSPKGVGFPVNFYSNTVGSSASWDPKQSLWKVTSGGQPNGGIQSDNLLLQGNSLKAVNADGTGAIYLTPQTNVVLPTATSLKFDGVDSASGSGIFGDPSGALHLTSSKCLKLEPQIAVTIPTGIPLFFDGTCSIENLAFRSGIVNDPTTFRLTVGGQNGINLSAPASTSVNITSPACPLILGPNASFPSISSDTTGSILYADALSQINLGAPNTLLPSNARLGWGSTPNTTYIDTAQGFEMVNTAGDVRLRGNGNVILGPAGDVLVPGNQMIQWPNYGYTIGPNATNQFTIHSDTSPIVLDSPAAQSVLIPGANPTLTIGNSGHIIS